MQENKAAGVPYVPILPKPKARVMFVGRDPSPRTASIVGIRGGKSVFINEIFGFVDSAKISDDDIYITDLCKCHWRTSVGKPLPMTKDRSSELDISIAQTCLKKWLVREIEMVKPQLIIAFGEELYQILRPYIKLPKPAPEMLSVSKDKSIPDAEVWFVDNGPMTLEIKGQVSRFAFLRHPGNSVKVLVSTDKDKRRQYYEASAERVIQLLKAS